MPIRSRRLIGFAFANADLLIEISASGGIEFAMGASEALSGRPETALVGRAWKDFIDPADQAVMAAFLNGLEPGQRAGPVIVRLAEAHAISDAVEAAILAAYPNAEVIIHQDPAGLEQPPLADATAGIPPGPAP